MSINTTAPQFGGLRKKLAVASAVLALGGGGGYSYLNMHDVQAANHKLVNQLCEKTGEAAEECQTARADQPLVDSMTQQIGYAAGGGGLLGGIILTSMFFRRGRNKQPKPGKSQQPGLLAPPPTSGGGTVSGFSMDELDKLGK